MVTLVAVPRPLLLTVMSKPIAVPALTGPTGLADLAMWIDGQLTVTEAVETSPPSLPDATVAVLLTVVQSSLVVAEVRWMGPTLPEGAMLAKLQFKVCAPTAPVIAQPAKAGLSDQLRSPPGGSGSLMVTLVAVPRPLLLTVMSKPMAVPALTGPTGLAALAMW